VGWTLSRLRIRFKGYVGGASRDEPQYLIKSEKTDHFAMHQGSALKKTERAANADDPASGRRKPAGDVQAFSRDAWPERLCRSGAPVALGPPDVTGG